ncbi:MAG: TIGR03936 family radical SAM-associated protein [Angustibacter sp.]
MSGVSIPLACHGQDCHRFLRLARGSVRDREGAERRMTRRTPEGPPPEPVVQRVRLQYAKRGRLRFSSHRDFQRALERALRRAEIPMAYSAGFHPHPRISFAGAAPTGTASEAEYVELALARRCDPEHLRRVLDESLPEGLDVVRVVEADGPALGDRLQASRWRIRLLGVQPTEVGAAVAAFLARDRVEVDRSTKNGTRSLDARGPVIQLSVIQDSVIQDLVTQEPGAAPVVLDLLIRHVIPTVRPAEVVAALGREGGSWSSIEPQVTRVSQGPLVAGRLGDPLDSSSL